MLQFEHFSFSYAKSNRSQLDAINLHIHPGECVLLCGPSACGKTTLTKCINGLIPHFVNGDTEGTVTLQGENIATLPPYKIAERVGSVFQNPKTQFFNLDSNSELVFGLENLGVPASDINTRIRTVTADLHIDDLLDKKVLKLSGGEKQILALASIYAVNPDVYVLDEPSSNIDQAGIENLCAILSTLKAQGKTIIISEHRLYFLMDLIDRAVYINHGVIQTIYTGDELRTMNEATRIALGLRTFSLQSPAATPSPASECTGTLVVDQVSLGYKKTPLLTGLSFAADPGDIIAVTGNNGSGKSALLRVLCGLMKTQSGEIRYQGAPVSYKKRRQLCYMTMQDVVHQLFSDSVWEEFGLLNKTISPARITAILERLDLLSTKDKHPMTLSGGQKQRLALAVAAIADKDILIFDEPTSGLDYANMCKVGALIKELAEDKIIFVATHDQELKALLCTREIAIHNGTASLYDLNQ